MPRPARRSGVVGALAGVIGSMMALEAVKLIAGAGEPLTGRLLIYDALAAETRTVRIGGRSRLPGLRARISRARGAGTMMRVPIKCRATATENTGREQ